MLSLTHTLVSLPLGLYGNHPVLIFLAAIVGHVLCDTLLHWNIYPDAWRRYPVGLVAADVLGGLAIAWLVLGQQIFSVSMGAAILGGNLPDILQVLWNWLPVAWRRQRLGRLAPLFHWHDALQRETDNVAVGLVWQVILVAGALVLVSRYHR